MRCALSGLEFPSEESYWSNGELAVSRGAAAELPPDFRQMPFIHFLALQGDQVGRRSFRVLKSKLVLRCRYRFEVLLSVTIAFMDWPVYCVCVPNDEVWHLFRDGKYVKSANSESYFTVVDILGSLVNDYTKDAVGRLPETQVKAFRENPSGVWVLTDTGTHSSLSNRTPSGIVKTVEEAEQWCLGEDRYHFFKDGQYVKTTEPGLTFRYPTVGKITLDVSDNGRFPFYEDHKPTGHLWPFAESPQVSVDGAGRIFHVTNRIVGGNASLQDLCDMAREGILKYRIWKATQAISVTVNKLLERGHGVKIIRS